MRSRTIQAACLAASLTVLTAVPVGAHALHGDVDAPLPFAAYLVGAAIMVGLLAWLWVVLQVMRPGQP